MNNTLIIGLGGLFITLTINLASVLFLDHHATAFFSEDWWSVWFPSYLVWLVLTVIGIGRQIRKTRD